MIFVAVGTQFPFDRLVRYVDEWLMSHDVIEPAFAQIGTGDYLPQVMTWEHFIDSETYLEKIKQADLIISHAGMGNIITAIEQQTPIIVVNRQQALGEHRNDHQADGLEWMAKLDGVYTASSKERLYDLLNNQYQLKSQQAQTLPQRQRLIQHINQLIASS